MAASLPVLGRYLTFICYFGYSINPNDDLRARKVSIILKRSTLAETLALSKKDGNSPTQDRWSGEQKRRAEKTLNSCSVISLAVLKPIIKFLAISLTTFLALNHTVVLLNDLFNKSMTFMQLMIELRLVITKFSVVILVLSWHKDRSKVSHLIKLVVSTSEYILGYGKGQEEGTLEKSNKSKCSCRNGQMNLESANRLIQKPIPNRNNHTLDQRAMDKQSTCSAGVNNIKGIYNNYTTTHSNWDTSSTTHMSLSEFNNRILKWWLMCLLVTLAHFSFSEAEIQAAHHLWQWLDDYSLHHLSNQTVSSSSLYILASFDNYIYTVHVYGTRLIGASIICIICSMQRENIESLRWRTVHLIKHHKRLACIQCEPKANRQMSATYANNTSHALQRANGILELPSYFTQSNCTCRHLNNFDTRGSHSCGWAQFESNPTMSQNSPANKCNERCKQLKWWPGVPFKTHAANYGYVANGSTSGLDDGQALPSNVQVKRSRCDSFHTASSWPFACSRHWPLWIYSGLESCCHNDQDKIEFISDYVKKSLENSPRSRPSDRELLFVLGESDWLQVIANVQSSRPCGYLSSSLWATGRFLALKTRKCFQSALNLCSSFQFQISNLQLIKMNLRKINTHAGHSNNTNSNTSKVKVRYAKTAVTPTKTDSHSCDYPSNAPLNCTQTSIESLTRGLNLSSIMQNEQANRFTCSRCPNQLEGGDHCDFGKQLLLRPTPNCEQQQQQEPTNQQISCRENRHSDTNCSEPSNSMAQNNNTFAGIDDYHHHDAAGESSQSNGCLADCPYDLLSGEYQRDQQRRLWAPEETPAAYHVQHQVIGQFSKNKCDCKPMSSFIESQLELLARKYELIRRINSRIQKCFGPMLLVQFMALFLMSCIDVVYFSISFNPNTKTKYIIMSGMILLWLPYFLLYKFSSDINISSRELLRNIRRLARLCLVSYHTEAADQITGQTNHKRSYQLEALSDLWNLSKSNNLNMGPTLGCDKTLGTPVLPLSRFRRLSAPNNENPQSELNLCQRTKLFNKLDKVFKPTSLSIIGLMKMDKFFLMNFGKIIITASVMIIQFMS